MGIPIDGGHIADNSVVLAEDTNYAKVMYEGYANYAG